MQFAWQILTHTPIWAWVLLAWLIWQGIRAMRPRTGTIGRALIVPAVFIVWGLSRLLSRVILLGRWSHGSVPARSCWRSAF